MKGAIVCCAIAALLGLTSCRRGHEKIGDAPRTESASSIAGWKKVSTSGIVLELPSDWKMIDLDRQSMEEGLEKGFGNDPRFATMRRQASAIAKPGSVKLLAFDPSTVGSGFGTNCSVVILELPGQMTLEQIAEATVQQISPMVAAGTQPKLEYTSRKSGKVALIESEIKPPNPSVPTVVSLAYVNLRGSKLATVTFTMSDSDEPRIRKVADQAMDTFRFTN